MKREELKRYTSSDIEEIDNARLDASEDGIIKMTRAYIASEADSVMDEYEARIKHLEEILDSDPRTNLRLDEENAMLRKRINELEAQLENVQASMYTENVDANMALIKANERIKELEAENARLKAKVPKWHYLTKPLYTEDGVNYYDLPAEHGFYIVDCGGKKCVQSEYDPDYDDWCDLVCTTKVLRWCEYPTTEESSATEKENG